MRENTGYRMQNSESQAGMSLLAVLAFMALLAIALLAVAPTIQQSVQRERELETIRRGEEIADAIRQYVIANNGKLPDSMDRLLEGIPFGTKKRQILRPSAAVDPLSEDGKWRLIEFSGKGFVNFARRVQIYNNGVLPSNPQPRQFFDQYAFQIVNNKDTQNDDDLQKDSEEEYEVKTDKTPFIGVASQSKSRSIIAYYGIENHSKWIFTPMFRGIGNSSFGGNGNGSGGGIPPNRQPPNQPNNLVTPIQP